MKYLVLIFLFSLALSAKAQLAVVSDPDGYVNVREKGSVKSKIFRKLNTDCIVLYDGEADNSGWKNIFYSPENTTIFSKSSNSAISLKQGYVTGYVHASRVIPIDNLSRMVFKKGTGYIGKYDTVKISITTKLFSAKSHKILKSSNGCVNCNKKFVDKIDGKKPWGIDGDLPKREIAVITLSINGKVVTMPRDSYNDIYEPSLTNLKIYWDKKGNIYLYMPDDSDGAGGYDVVWVITNGELVKRYVDSIG